MSQVTYGWVDGGEDAFERGPSWHGVDGLLDIAQLACYGVKLTRHGREHVEGRAG